MSSSPAAEWEEPAEAHAGEVRKLSTLLEASQALSATLDLKESLKRVLEILGRHHGAVRSTVVLLNENSGDVELEAASGAITAKRVRYRVGEGVTGKVVQTGKPMVVPRVSREPMFLSRAAERPELPGQELTYISAPIALDSKTVGPDLKVNVMKVVAAIIREHKTTAADAAFPKIVDFVKNAQDDKLVKGGIEALGIIASAGRYFHWPPSELHEISARKLARYMDRAEIAQREAAQAAEEALERQRLADKQKQWDSAWGKSLPGIGSSTPGKLAPGERIVIPEE